MTIATLSDISKKNRGLARDFLILGTVFFVLSAVAYFATVSWAAPIPRDSTTLVIGRDFLNFWLYGQAASADLGLLYDPDAYKRVLSGLLGNDYTLNWAYPPSIMLLAAPFAQLDYLPALFSWTALAFLILIFVGRHHLNDWRLLLALVFSPAAVFCLMSGQNSFFTAAMLITIFAWLDRRPVLAGILIGCLTLKPQLGLLFPIMLVVSRRWRVFCSATATAVGIVALTAILFGSQVWIDFVLKSLPSQHTVLADPQLVGTPFYPTIFMNMRGTGASYAVAMMVQLCFSAFAVAAVIWTYRFCKNADPRMLLALFLTCSICASPYLLAYDVLGLTFAVLLLLDKDQLDGPGRRLVQLVYWLPVLQIGLGALHIPGPALIPPAFAIYLLFRLAADQSLTPRSSVKSGGDALKHALHRRA
jgi:Glycosyltransferase family 87